MAALASLPRAAVVVEDRYSSIFKLTRVRPRSSPTGSPKLQVRYPNVPIVFCETRAAGAGVGLPLPRRGGGASSARRRRRPARSRAATDDRWVPGGRVRPLSTHRCWPLKTSTTAGERMCRPQRRTSRIGRRGRRSSIPDDTASGGTRMFFHPTQSAQLAALRQARYLDEAAIARMVPRRSLRRRLARCWRGARGRPESAATAGRSTAPRPISDAAVVD